MEQYIRKTALVAEIRRRFDEYSSNILKHYDACKEAKAQELGKILTILDTLEVKEVDNVWHDANETPKGAGDKEILVQFSDFHTSVLEIDDWEYLDHQTKWAYLKDLI